MTSSTERSNELAEAIRVRLRRDPGDELLVDGKKTKVTWPPSFIRLATGIFAEVVIDLPTSIQTFPMDAWNGAADELLNVAWIRTLNHTKYQIGEIDAGLPEPLLAITGEAPYVTAFAMSPCSVFKQPDGPTAFAALVSIPTPEFILLHMFMDETLSGKTAIAARMSEIAKQNFEAYEEEMRISPYVYLSYANKGLQLEKA